MYNRYNPCSIKLQVTVALLLLVWLIVGLIPPSAWAKSSCAPCGSYYSHWDVIPKKHLCGTAEISSVIFRSYFVLLQRATTVHKASSKIMFWELILGVN